MNENLNLLSRTTDESYAAGMRDSRHFLSLYRSYLRGAADAAGCEYGSDFKHSIAAMAFALAAWFVTMYFVFRT